MIRRLLTDVDRLVSKHENERAVSCG
jgi:hypothetical protein